MDWCDIITAKECGNLEDKSFELLTKMYSDMTEQFKKINEKLDSKADKTGAARIEAISILLRDFSECYHGNERRKWGLVNNGLCVIVSWCAGIMSDWKTYEEILQKAENK